MSVALLVSVAAGGLLGAPSRFLLDRAVDDRFGSELPWGTILVNITGSLLFGLLTGLAIGHRLGPVPKTLLGTGFCGAYTTFSAFSYETLRFIEDGAVRKAVVNVGSSVVFGLAAAGAGLALGLAF